MPTDTLREQLQSALTGRYEIGRELGRGGMATVYLARDIKHDRRVALKLLNPELGAVLGAERFLSEIRVTANLQHPNLLPLFDSGSAEGLLYYVMPYVEGESLRHRLNRERQLPVDEAIRIAASVADALDYAHQRGVIHRDLKPENILMQHGQPVVADFGIALAVSNAGGERVTQTGLSLGTPQYMSPEQATGDRVIDARADVYSLGAVTYEMLAGEPPHYATTAQAIIAKLMTEVPRPLTVIRHTVPPHVDEAVRCALEKLPADRFATAGEFAQGLRGGSIPHRTQHTRMLVAQKARRARLLVPALAGASLLALIFAVLWWRGASRAEAPGGGGAIRFVLDLPPEQRITIPEGSSVNVSPDGRTIGYVATIQGSGTSRVFVRRLDSLAARQLTGCVGGNTPTFSPDGRWVACKTPNDLRKVPVSGGGAEIITALTDWQNFTWSSKGDVVVAQGGEVDQPLLDALELDAEFVEDRRGVVRVFDERSTLESGRRAVARALGRDHPQPTLEPGSPIGAQVEARARRARHAKDRPAAGHAGFTPGDDSAIWPGESMVGDVVAQRRGWPGSGHTIPPTLLPMMTSGGHTKTPEGTAGP